MHPIDFPYIDDFCDDEVYVFSNIGQGPKGPEGPEGKVDEQLIATTVDNWLDEHPEAITTVQDGAITSSKINASLWHDIRSYTDVKSGISYVGNYGAIEKDASVDWQSIVDAIAEVSETIDFGNGQWYFSDGIVIPNTIRCIIGNGAVLTAKARFTDWIKLSMFTFSESKRFFFMFGLSFDGATLVNNIFTALENSTNAVHVANCSFRDYISFGIYGTLGTCVYDCYFANQTNKNTGCAIRTNTDSLIANCKVFYNRYGMRIAGNTSVIGCYIFSTEFDSPVHGIVSNDFYNGYASAADGVNIISCEFDCITYCICGIENVSVSECRFYWNGNDDTLDTTRAIFVIRGTTFRGYSFDKNWISCANSPLILGKVVSFLSIRTAQTGLRLYGYTSRGCVYPVSLSSDAIAKFAITCGFSNNPLNVELNTDGSQPSPNDYQATHFVKANTEPGPTAMRCNIYIPQTGTWVIGRGGAPVMKSLNTSLAALHVYYLQNSDFYITTNPFGISEIELAGIPLNMEWASVREAIDTSSYTVVNNVAL